LKKRTKKLLLKLGNLRECGTRILAGCNNHRILCVASVCPTPVRNIKIFCFFFLIPSFAFAHSAAFDRQQQALQAAQAQAVRHHQEAAEARRKAARDAAQAAVLAQQQVTAAAALRQLEDQTAAAASTLAALDSQSQAAKASLHANATALAALMPIMLRLSNQPAATMLAVPASPTDAIRGILVLQGIAAEIEDKAKTVHAQAAQVAMLQAQTLLQQQQLAAAVATQQQAEDALTRQISAADGAETSDLDIAAANAAAEMAATRNVHNLQSVIDKLQEKERASAAAARMPALPPSSSSKMIAAAGAPVAGKLVQAYGAATVAGPAVGIIYRAAPGARVAAPCSGPVLYANRFQNYGLLVIMDCGNNYDAVLSGMHHLDVTAGQNLARGQPIGQMQGFDPGNPAAEPLLYVELRRNGTPVDPTAWLAKGGSG
jgi:septal ring factor EnvC (AmiA/AmiB activator)